jgi:hypothetical protein
MPRQVAHLANADVWLHLPRQPLKGIFQLMCELALQAGQRRCGRAASSRLRAPGGAGCGLRMLLLLVLLLLLQLKRRCQPEPHSLFPLT